MIDLTNLLIIKSDGTIKQINPFNKTEVWTVPERGKRPFDNNKKITKNLINSNSLKNCPFCPHNYLMTPPEHLRVIKENENYKYIFNVNVNEINKTIAEFRLIPNLFEIITYNYWVKNYNLKLTKEQQMAMESYISISEGFEHIINIINYKLTKMGYSDEEIMSMSKRQKLKDAESFFGGTHKIIIVKKHYIDNAKYEDELFSTKYLSTEEHYQYFKLTIYSMEQIYKSNQYVRYVSVFQNWLPDAGASIEHLHKQLVGIDEWGTSIENEIRLVKENPNIYNEAALNMAIYNNLVIAENDCAIAFADIGHIYPTIAIYSKSQNIRPFQHTDDEIRLFSNLVHSIHSAFEHYIPTNEEWFYTPLDAVYPMPCHILIKLRMNNPAGFEGGTKIYINPISPFKLRDQIVTKLFKLRENGQIDRNIRIAEECQLKINSLKYVRNFQTLWNF
ncbi:MAG TPA: DUF4921 family protein [bacterium]|nr:DUF4921 family protein [bacterium]